MKNSMIISIRKQIGLIHVYKQACTTYLIVRIGILVLVKRNYVLDFLKNNTLRGSSREGIIFEKIQGRVCFTLKYFGPSSFIIIKNKMM